MILCNSRIYLFHLIFKLLSMITGTTYQAIVGEVIALHRKELELNQAELAKMIGMSQSAWSRVEKGFSNLTLEQLTKVAAALEIEPSQIISEADTAKKKLEANGISVAERKSDTTGWLLLGAAALALVIIATRGK